MTSRTPIPSADSLAPHREGWLGDFDFRFLCMPQLPYGNHGVKRKPSPFYGLEDELPLAVAIVAGFQWVARPSPCPLVRR